MQAVLSSGQQAAHAVPVRALVLLSGAVLLAHLLLLQYTPLMMRIDEPMGTRAFVTRSLQVGVPALTEVQAPSPRAVPTRTSISPPAPRAASPVAAAAAAQPTTPPPATPETAPTAEQVVQAAPEPEAAASAPAAPEPAPPAPAPIAMPTISAQAAAAPAPQGEPAPLPKDAALVARAYTVPGSVRLKFNATGERNKTVYLASGELLWQLRDDNSYAARMEIGAFIIGARVLSSTGRITADGLAPTRFSDKFRSEQAAHFERDKGRVIFSSNAPEAALLPGAQDQLSVFVQLASMIAGDPIKYPAGTSISIQTVGPRSAEPWVFTVDAEEKLQLPGGELMALKVVRNPRKEYDQKVEIWLAPKLAYLPARIRITQANGDFVDQQWRSTGSP